MVKVPRNNHAVKSGGGGGGGGGGRGDGEGGIGCLMVYKEVFTLLLGK